MDLATFKKRRSAICAQMPEYRRLCQNCLQPDFSCYCEWLRPFDAKIQFVILIHPIEVRRRIATGRMSHLSLKKSRLIMGHDFSLNSEVNRILARQDLHCVMLYPGPQSTNLTLLNSTQRLDYVPPNKQLAVFVIDGTWATARKMVRLSQNLKSLPRMCFTPTSPSNFRVRQQPKPDCYSTIEAIHHSIDLLGPACGPWRFAGAPQSDE